MKWITEKGGMVLLNTHPDYMNFSKRKSSFEEYDYEYYKEFLEHIQTRYRNQYWHALPKEMATFWSQYENM